MALRAIVAVLAIATGVNAFVVAPPALVQYGQSSCRTSVSMFSGSGGSKPLKKPKAAKKAAPKKAKVTGSADAQKKADARVKAAAAKKAAAQQKEFIRIKKARELFAKQKRAREQTVRRMPEPMAPNPVAAD